ncbi:alkaline phosphatase D family protein [Phenylobacterium sp.]|jgi:alkaline phosphatase D|uniref:alkaline phosphatase D family protein n=1 Tax=Phenylobacterium sp. TaxID=1871053 RepID=UPI002F931508
MKIDRRRALALLGVGAASPAAAQPNSERAVAFRHGVASGDPLQDRVVIWTRFSPDRAGAPLEYTWIVRPLDGRGSERRGRGVTGPERDYTAKVDVTGLQPGRAYGYQFAAGGISSPVGRTRTLPVGPTPDVVLAVASCTLYPNGYFNAYRAIADLPRVDAVLHLGDYIYEYGGPGSYGMDSPVASERPHDPPREIVSLDDYRRRHAQYKSDPDLQAAHARAPWIVAWDDHETANNSWEHGAENHTPRTEGDWEGRKAAALKAYYEWMPIREPRPRQSLIEASERAFHFGDLASLIMIETRIGARDLQLEYEKDMPEVNGQPDVAGFRAKLNDPRRRMMSARQEVWVADELSRSVRAGHAWQVIGNQVVMGRVLPFGYADLTPGEQAGLTERAKRRLQQRDPLAKLKLPVALDMWDGYPVDRERLYGLFRRAGARPVVLSGDSHSFWANELFDDAGRRVACEFGTTGITSPGAGELAPGVDTGTLVARINNEVLYNNQVDKGFVLLTLTRGAARADMIATPIETRQFRARTVKSFRVTPQGAGVSPTLDLTAARAPAAGQRRRRRRR